MDEVGSSLSLEDDLKESAFNIYHRSVAKIQQEERNKLMETAQVICGDANKLIGGKNKDQIEKIRSRAQWIYDEEKKLHRKRLDDAIKVEKEKLVLLLSNIEAYARTRVQAPD